MPTWAYTPPHTFHDGVGEVASGVQVMEDLTQLAEGWLKLSGAAVKLQIACGKAETGAFDSAAGRSRWTGNIPHGMGITPKYAVVTAGPIAITENGGGIPEAVAVSVNSLSGTNINVIATAPGTTNNGTTLYWIAVG